MGARMEYARRARAPHPRACYERGVGRIFRRFDSPKVLDGALVAAARDAEALLRDARTRADALLAEAERLATERARAHTAEAEGAAFAKLGTEKSNGSKLVCLDSGFKRPGLYEVECGTPLSRVIDELGQGFARPTKALHIGGPLGGIVPLQKISELGIDFESFQKAGFLLGHASVLSIPSEFPMAKYLEHLFEFTAAESCGKCFPCRIGSTRGKELIEGALKHDRKIDRALFNDLLETMEIGSLCALGGGLPLGVKNALQYFGNELNVHFVE